MKGYTTLGLSALVVLSIVSYHVGYSMRLKEMKQQEFHDAYEQYCTLYGEKTPICSKFKQERK